MFRLCLAVVAAFLLTLPVAGAHAATLQPIGSFDQPIYVTSDPGNPERLFVVEREGEIELVQGNNVSTFADLSSVVSCCEGERGLLSIALAPSFDTTGLLYVYYTGKVEPGEIHVAELRAEGGGAAIGALRNLLTIPHPGASNHNGGQLQFGPDGDLYISTGDGGGGNDEFQNAQDPDSLLGKILRIDPRPGIALPYSVPPDNPFPLATGAAQTVWSLGLRNPFRFSFDRGGGNMTIGDVGQNAREEIDLAKSPGSGRVGGAGANYGWNCREGLIAGPGTDPECSTLLTTAFVNPVFDYPHLDPGNGAAYGCAIIGGYTVRDPSLDNLYGRYVYGDLCTGEIRSLSLLSNPSGSDRSEGLHVANLNSFGEDSCGRLYAVSGDGTVARFVGATPTSCPSSKAAEELRPAFVGLRAARRRVERRRKVQIIAWVSPCQGRRGQSMQLLRGGRRIATKRLNVACTTHFLTRINGSSVFQAKIAEDETYVAATSRRLKIKIQRRRSR